MDNNFIKKKLKHKLFNNDDILKMKYTLNEE